MVYSTSNPPRLINSDLTGGFQQWAYISADAAATVDDANYFTNGGSLGMKVGDVVWVKNTGGNITTLHQVSATGDGTTDVNDATVINQTDTN